MNENIKRCSLLPVALCSGVLYLATACAQTQSADLAASYGASKAPQNIATCHSESLVNGAKVKEDSIVTQNDKIVTIEYRYSASKVNGELESGIETITGELDPIFNQAHDHDTLALLLESAKMTIVENSKAGEKNSTKILGKTEISRVADRLFIEENDIILKLTGCVFN